MISQQNVENYPDEFSENKNKNNMNRTGVITIFKKRELHGFPWERGRITFRGNCRREGK